MCEPILHGAPLGRAEVTGDREVPGYLNRGTKLSRGAEGAVGASEKVEALEFQTPPRTPRWEMSAPAVKAVG